MHRIHLYILPLYHVDSEPGYCGVVADAEQDLGQVSLARLHVLLEVSGQVLEVKGQEGFYHVYWRRIQFCTCTYTVYNCYMAEQIEMNNLVID